MNIYVSHSRNFDYHKELYLPIETSSLIVAHTFVFPHKHSDNLFHTKDLFKSKKCDLVLAEVSYTSTGQGIELGWADLMGINIVGIHRPDMHISKSLKAVTSDILQYTDTKDMLHKIAELISHEQG